MHKISKELNMRTFFSLTVLVAAISAVAVDTESELERRGRGKMWFRKALEDGTIGPEWSGRLTAWKTENHDDWMLKRHEWRQLKR